MYSYCRTYRFSLEKSVQPEGRVEVFSAPLEVDLGRLEVEVEDVDLNIPPKMYQTVSEPHEINCFPLFQQAKSSLCEDDPTWITT